MVKDKRGLKPGIYAVLVDETGDGQISGEAERNDFRLRLVNGQQVDPLSTNSNVLKRSDVLLCKFFGHRNDMKSEDTQQKNAPRGNDI